MAILNGDRDELRAIIGILVHRLGGSVTISVADVTVTDGMFLREQATVTADSAHAKVELKLVSVADAIKEMAKVS